MSEGNGSAALLGYPEEWAEDQAAIDDLDSQRYVDDSAAALGQLKGIATRALSRDAAMHTLLVHAAKDGETLSKQLGERDARLFLEIEGIAESQREIKALAAEALKAAKESLSLAASNAVRLARLDNEREVTRQQVKDVHRWAEALKKDANESSQQRVVTAKEAAAAIEKAAAATVEKAAAEARADFANEARRSHHDDDRLERTVRQARNAERRARRWQIAAIVIGAIVTLGGGIALFEWQQRAHVEMTGPTLKVR